MSDTGSKHKILIVDDEPANIKVMGALLKDDYKLVIATSGPEALECAQAEVPPDLILLDIIMPGMDGYEVCRRLKSDKKTRDIPVIFSTAMSGEEDEAKGLELGAVDYVTKPFSPAVVKARVKTHLHAQSQNKALKETITELNRLDKLKDDFLAVCSHDLRSPLCNMLSFTDLLLADDSVQEKHKDALKDIITLGNSLLALISDILDLSRIEAGREDSKMTPLSVFEVAKSTMNTIRYTAIPKGVKLELINNATNSSVSGNLNSLSRIFNNLLSNAVKFTPAGGTVKLQVDQMEDQKIAISVSDTGIGIREDSIPCLFDKFSKISKEGTAGELGTGLGLAITKELVEKHGGDIEVTSRVGKGSTFTVVLPTVIDATSETR
jgi:signal transduction histidine kinase